MGYGSMIGEFGGQIAGDVSAMSNDAHVQRMLEEMMRRWEELPDAEKVHFAPLLRSGLNEVREDPRFKNIETSVLDRLMELANSGGMTDADKAKLEQSKLAALDYERGVRGRDEQTLARRGLANSGAQLSADIAAQQGGIDRAYEGDLMTAASASDRALDALTGAGDYAALLSGRDLNQKNLAAGADDQISRFNASRSDEMDMYNSSLAQRNALARLGGMDRATGMEVSNEKALGERERRRWRGYGKQAGALYDASGSGE